MFGQISGCRKSRHAFRSNSAAESDRHQRQPRSLLRESDTRTAEDLEASPLERAFRLRATHEAKTLLR
jgi:hypothetical protein